MKAFKLVIFLFSTLIAMHSFAKEPPIETGFFNNDAIYAYDTVAYFTQSKAVKGSEKYQTQWRGALWSFSSQQHLDMFKQEPEKYAPQYGGYCAYAMADGRLVGVDEEAFTIVDGKLYLNYSKSVMEDWREDIPGYVEKADVAYPTLVDL